MMSMNLTRMLDANSFGIDMLCSSLGFGDART